MAFFKWFRRIELLQANDRMRPPAPLPPFSFAALQPQGLAARIAAWLTSWVFAQLMPPILRLCQAIWAVPVIRFLNLAIVTRDADVRQVLNDSSSFGVPYGPEMNDLGAGTTFGLGLDGEGHARQRAIMTEVMGLSDGRHLAYQDEVLAHARACAEALIASGAGEIDVIRDFVTRIATETAGRYFGLEIDDADSFAKWSLAASTMLFGDPTGDRKTRDIALNAGARLRMTIDRSLARAQRNHRNHPDSPGRDTTVIDRLIILQRARSDQDPVSNGELRAMLLGMVTGFVPTNTLAAAKMIDELLRRPERFAEAKHRAAAGDRHGLRAMLQEAARLNSALAPGQWRIATRDATIAAGTRHARQVKAGTVIMVSTMTALRDPRRFSRPGQFDPDRDKAGDLMFGWGPHACMGAELAIELITEMLLPLFAQPSLRPVPGRHGRMAFTGPFPVRLDMTYDHPGSGQTMALVIVPIPPDFALSRAEVEALIAPLGHPAGPAMKAALDATGIVHFASLSSIESSRGIDIVFELSVDGEIGPALAAIAGQAGALLRPVYARAGLGETEDLAAFLERHVVRLNLRPWGATGLDFNGTPEFPVAMIARQERFASLTRRILADYLSREMGSDNQPMAALRYVRRIMRLDRYHALMTNSPRAQLISEARHQRFDAFILKPGRKRMKTIDFVPRTYLQTALAFFRSRHALVIIAPFALTLAIAGYSLWRLVWTPPVLVIAPLADQHLWHWLTRGWHVIPAHTGPALWGWFTIIGGALLLAIILWATTIAAAIWQLRRLERADVPSAERADDAKMTAILAHEDNPGFMHNHFMAVGTLKPGWLRTLTHMIALWGIKMIILFYYRPGFVLNMGTIHYARWWRLPGTRRVVFFSNFDGSWENYLEDFITRARWGQTAAWSNWTGFPPTRFLIFDGAQNGDRFKQWVRTQQQPVPFWYSRFPQLSTDNIRTNALIHHGLARARSADEAREWLRCFSSMPQVENRVETHEVQSIVYRGMGRLPHSANLLLRLPETADGQLGRWLNLLLGNERRVRAGDPLATAIDQFGDCFVRKGNGSAYQARLAIDHCISFGEGANGTDRRGGDKQLDAETQPSGRFAVTLAFTAVGLSRFRIEGAGGDDDLPGVFPPAFRRGMASRAAILGDLGEAGPENWRWSDRPEYGGAVAEAVLMLHADTPQALDRAKALHLALVSACGGTCICALECAPAPGGLDREHFGFRDGISQPVIKGSIRARRGAAERDLMEPGEFILGYASNQGFLPPSPLVRAEADPERILPMPDAAVLGRFPDFGAIDAVNLPGDLGRNGSYLVIREIEQHVDRFEDYARRTAAILSGEQDGGAIGQHSYRALLRITGQVPDATWIKAKMVGRWPDGRPLVGNARSAPHAADGDMCDGAGTARTENDFEYGRDDPQGIACPFAAHIRRTNPRGSREPGDATEQMITNRHRLLRRGRSYTRGSEKGLFFAALCSDIERQFEFVQQTWVNAPTFHGLAQEPDPLIGWSGEGERIFTIPTSAGPVTLTGLDNFVQVRAGGYFFLPGRTAIAYLKERAFTLSS